MVAAPKTMPPAIKRTDFISRVFWNGLRSRQASIACFHLIAVPSANGSAAPPQASLQFSIRCAPTNETRRFRGESAKYKRELNGNGVGLSVRAAARLRGRSPFGAAEARATINHDLRSPLARNTK